MTQRHVKLAILLALMLMVLCACGSNNLTRNATVTPVPGVTGPQPGAEAPARIHADDQVNLYFRFGTEPCLAPAQRVISYSPTESRELALMEALLAGPGQQDAELTALFPAGTRVLSVSAQGDVVFVTLSRQIMNGYGDEPLEWQDDPYWSVEVPLRRRLCMQSIAATLTENCEGCRRVQILVEQTGDEASVSMRLRRSYYMNGAGENELTDPITRDESLILSPARTLDAVLTLYIARDWTRLGAYVSDAGLDFTDVMGFTEPVAQYHMAGGSITPDGNTAVYTVVMVRPDGSERQTILYLHRNAGVWKITRSQLTDWQEE